MPYRGNGESENDDMPPVGLLVAIIGAGVVAAGALMAATLWLVEAIF